MRYPAQVTSQKNEYGDFFSFVAQNAFCEQWITFVSAATAKIGTMTQGSLGLCGQLGVAMARVFDFAASDTTSLPLLQYLARLSESARSLTLNTGLLESLAQQSSVTIISLTHLASNTLALLLAWDPSQGYTPPGSVTTLANQLMSGVSIV